MKSKTSIRIEKSSLFSMFSCLFILISSTYNYSQTLPIVTEPSWVPDNDERDYDITFFQDVTDIAGVAGTLSSGASGMAWGDYDNDGFQDIYVAYGGNGGGLMGDILFKNRMDGTFEDVSVSSGLLTSESYSMGVACGDYDNDGNLDLFVTDMLDLSSRLLRNDGSGHFEDVTLSAGIGNITYCVSCSWADVNNDGHLDLYVGRFGYSRESILFLNNGDGTFRDFTDESNAGEYGFCHGIAFGDYDSDGDQDLYVVFTTRYPYEQFTVLFENDGNGVFTDITENAGVGADVHGWMSGSWADYDNDGDPDLFVTNLSGFGYSPRLYKNKGDGTFSNVADEAGIILSTRMNNASWGDYDNDGYLDLYISTQVYYNDKLYHNGGDGTFSEVSLQCGINLNQNTWSSGWDDYDRDGFLDLYVTTFYSEDSCRNVLYRNIGNENNWLVIELQGTISNRSGIGSRVKLIADTLYMIREVNGGMGVIQNSLPVEFGIGKANLVDSLVIKWPSGIVDSYINIQPNQYIIARENEKLISGIREDEDRSMIPDSYILYQNYPNPFNSSTTICFNLEKSCFVTLRIYDVLGREIETLVSGQRAAGEYAIQWSANDLPSGIYLYRLEAGEFAETKKFILQK